VRLTPAAPLKERRMPITPFLRGRAFEPEVLRVMGIAFEEACRSLQIADPKGSNLAEILAKKIIGLAEFQVLDPGELRDGALQALRQERWIGEMTSGALPRRARVATGGKSLQSLAELAARVDRVHQKATQEIASIRFQMDKSSVLIERILNNMDEFQGWVVRARARRGAVPQP